MITEKSRQNNEQVNNITKKMISQTSKKTSIYQLIKLH